MGIQFSERKEKREIRRKYRNWHYLWSGPNIFIFIYFRIKRQRDKPSARAEP